MHNRVCPNCDLAFRARNPKQLYCSDNCRKRAAERRAPRATCECGEMLGHDSLRRNRQHCRTCWEAYAHAAHAERDLQIEQWWAAGLTMREIAAQLGWSFGHVQQEIVRLRRYGANLPYRRSARDLAAIRAGTLRYHGNP